MARMTVLGSGCRYTTLKGLRLKGKSSYVLLREFPMIRQRYWGRHVWARGYFCRSSGNVTDEVIKAYIENQCHDHDDTFSIEGEASRRESPST